MNREDLLARAVTELEDLREDGVYGSNKILYSMALSLLALHQPTDPIHLAANELAKAVHSWFIEPSGETFSTMQHHLGFWRAAFFGGVYEPPSP